MRILILGAGEVGFHLARQLSDEGHEVVVIEENRDRVRAIDDALDAMVVHGNAAALSTLEKAGVSRTDLLLAVTSLDEINLMACLSAAQYGVPIKIARVSKADYFDNAGILPPERLGVDRMINPARECAIETYQLLQSAAATEFAQFEGGLVQLIGLRVRPGAPIEGKTLAILGEDRRRSRYLVAAIVRGGVTIVPRGSDMIQADDQIFVIGRPDHLPEILPEAGYSGFTLRRVVIAGGGRVGLLLAQMLEEHRIGCTILETSRQRAVALAEQLRSSLVLHGDATDLDLLEMEGIGEADGFVAFTGSDETNLLSCLLAKNLGTRKVIALIDRMNYIPLVSRVGVDAAVSPRLATVNAILGYVRRGSVLSVASLKGTSAEAIEFDVGAGFRHAGVPLAEVRLPSGSLIGAIVRGNRVIIPRGGDAIRIGDRVIVFTLTRSVAEVEAIFA
jgi:trk system potassium uptake protein